MKAQDVQIGQRIVTVWLVKSVPPLLTGTAAIVREIVRHKSGRRYRVETADGVSHWLYRDDFEPAERAS